MITIREIDYHNTQDAEDFLILLDSYSQDAFGAGKPLSEHSRTHLLPLLQETEAAHSFIAWWNGKPVGLVNSFMTVSTFKGRRLLNIHDVVVKDTHRGKGISRKLFEHIEQFAREQDCCKLTLEVLTNNHIAKNAYQRFGFNAYTLDAENGIAEFWEKSL